LGRRNRILVEISIWRIALRYEIVPTMEIRKVVVIGGGFGGLAAARALAHESGRDGRNFEITVIDRRNHHLFQPLLYQVATAALSPADISFPIRSIFASEKNVRVVLDEVVGFDMQKLEVVASIGRYPFDALVVAAGAGHSYFGHDDWESFAPGLKTLEQATEIRRRILIAFERAEMEADSEKQRSLLTFVVVGGGPTGVELAGAIAEISRFTLERDFRRIDPSRTRVILIEAGSRLLANFDESLVRKATRDLEKMGVQIWTSTRVSEVTVDGVRLGQEFVQARTVIWAAGVKPSPLGSLVAEAVGGAIDPSGRVVVDEQLRVRGDKSEVPVFVIGDLAHANDINGNALPGLAPVAMQSGRYVAKVLGQMVRGEKSLAFHYNDKGQMATIGRRRAIVEAGALRFGGYLAWLTWLVVHIYYLIGFKNRFMVFVQWAWAYVTFRRGARLIQEKTSS
jgi:NADH:ubiquinone reductase (H+-translocating)